MMSYRASSTVLSESITVNRTGDVPNSLNCFCQCGERSLVYQYLTLFAACMVWVTTSIGLTLILKVILDPKASSVKFNYPLCITIFSFLVSFLILLCFVKPPDAIRSPEKRTEVLWQVVLPLSFGTAAEVATSNVAYPMISVSLICVLKCSTLMCSFLGGVLIGVERASLYTAVIMLFLSGGIVMASKELVVNDWHGIVWMCASSIAFSFRSLAAQKVQKFYSLNAWQISYFVMPGAAVLLAPFAVALESSIVNFRPEDDANLTMTVLAIVSIPILGLINMASLFEVVKLSSALTMAVLVSLRQLLSIGSAVLFFKDQWSILGLVGLIVALLSMVEYARYRASLMAMAIGEQKEVAPEDLDKATEDAPLLGTKQESKPFNSGESA